MHTQDTVATVGTVLEYRQQMHPPVQVTLPGWSSATVVHADALDCYDCWPRPTAIIVDGPYGLGKFPGDPKTADDLGTWYAAHAAAWARQALPETTLWFWCSEIGWAEVHPVLKLHGWRYRAAHVWDKGIGHVAGNCNGDTIRGFPVVTEICVQYVREARLPSDSGELLTLKEWLRSEWVRSGLPLSATNEACGVRNAATRKYFTQCHLWYFPPSDKMVALAEFATRHGRPSNRPYFSLDGRTPLMEEQWERLRSKWNHVHGVTNVWREPPVRGMERLKGEGAKCLHANQKPLKLIERTIVASSSPGDVIWEPFGGLCSAAVASLQTGRQCYSSEIISEYFGIAAHRIRSEGERLAKERRIFDSPETRAYGTAG